MKKIPWFEFGDKQYADDEVDPVFSALEDYIKEYGTQEIYNWIYEHGDHNNMMLGGLGWDPPADIGPYTFLAEYCRVNGFQTEDNRYICKTCGTKNEVREDGTRFCKKCEIPTADLGFGRVPD